MKYGLVSSRDKAYYQIVSNSASPLLDTAKNSETLKIWKDTLRDLGFTTHDQGLEPEDLFELVKDAFEKNLAVHLM